MRAPSSRSTCAACGARNRVAAVELACSRASGDSTGARAVCMVAPGRGESMNRRRLLAVLVAAVAATVLPGVAHAAQCDPIVTAPHYRGGVPTAEQVLGYSLGSREASAADINTYIAAVDAASTRVTSGTFATSWEGRPL